MNTIDKPIVSFPAATENASPVIKDLLVLGAHLGINVSERFLSLRHFLPSDHVCEHADLAHVYLVVAAHVESLATEHLGHVAGETTRKLLEEVAVGVIRRATATLRDVVRMFDCGDGPTIVTKSQSYGRFCKDLLTVEQILRCTNRPARDDKGQVIRDTEGKVVKLAGLFIRPDVFLTRRANRSEIERGVAAPLGYLDGLEALNNWLGGDEEITKVVVTLRAMTRGGRN